MKIRQMQYFIEVCKFKSITKAAESLHVAQPSISASIKEMENEIGVNLFRRYNKKLYLTKEGEYVLNRVTAIVENVDDMMGDFLELSKRKNHISLGLPLLVGSYLMPLILGTFHDKYPEIEIEVVEVGGLDSIQLIESEELDLTVTALGDHFGSNLNFMELFNSEYCFCVNKNHPLANRKTVTIEDIKDEPLVMLKSGFYVNKLVYQLYAKKGIEPNVLLYTKQLHTIKNLVNNNIASTFLLKESVMYDDNIMAIPLDESLSVTMGVVTKKGRQIYSDTKRLVQFLKAEM